MPRPADSCAPSPGAWALYVGLTLVVMAPVLRDPTHLAIGAPANDVWNHLWGHAWVAACVRAGELPIHTDLLAWPTGGSLWYIDTVGALLTLPVQLVAGPVAAYNTTVAGNLLLAAVGAHVLARRVGADARGALVAGAAFLLTPHVLAQVYNGVSESTAVGWVPLAVAAGVRATRSHVGRPRLRGCSTWRSVFATSARSAGAGASSRSPVGRSRGACEQKQHRANPGSPGLAARDGLTAGLLFGAATATSAYLGLFAVLTFGALLLAGLGRRGAHPTESPGTPRPPLLRPALAALAGVALVAGPPLALFAYTLHAADALVHRDPAFVWSTLLDHNRTDLLALVHPGHWYSPDLRALFHEDLLIVVYAGAALWIPAIVTLVTARLPAPPEASPRTWALLALGFTVLSLGPFLYVDGRWFDVAGGHLPLPYYALYRWVPGFTAVSHAYRFAVGTSLALCMIAALTVSSLSPRPRVARALAAAWIVARGVETLWLSPAVFPLPVTEVQPSPIPGWIATWEAADPPRTPGAPATPSAVLDLPLSLGPLERSATLSLQLTPGYPPHPIPFGLNDPLPDFLAANHYTRYLAELERRRSLLLPDELPLLDLAVGAHDLRARGLRWIVVHRDVYGEAAWARVAPLLDLTATLRHDGGATLLYELTPPGDGTASSPVPPG